MPTDAAVSQFLYTILKQLDLKSIDWQAVADELEITNGHAARMRYSRFKQQMEGIIPQHRKPKESTPRKRKNKSDKPADPDKKQKQEGQTAASIDSTEHMAPETAEPAVKQETIIKSEDATKQKRTIETEPTVKSENATVYDKPLNIKEPPSGKELDNFPFGPPRARLSILDWSTDCPTPSPPMPQPLNFSSPAHELRALTMTDYATPSDSKASKIETTVKKEHELLPNFFPIAYDMRAPTVTDYTATIGSKVVKVEPIMKKEKED
ncbi:MAG: hypothetical protein Q9166_004880 [cf. Caloplaca sp. 2 TL-2023]